MILFNEKPKIGIPYIGVSVLPREGEKRPFIIRQIEKRETKSLLSKWETITEYWATVEYQDGTTEEIEIGFPLDNHNDSLVS